MKHWQGSPSHVAIPNLRAQNSVSMFSVGLVGWVAEWLRLLSEDLMGRVRTPGKVINEERHEYTIQ